MFCSSFLSAILCASLLGSFTTAHGAAASAAPEDNALRAPSRPVHTLPEARIVDANGTSASAGASAASASADDFSPILELPPELVQQIFSFLSKNKDKASTAKVCQFFNGAMWATHGAQYKVILTRDHFSQGPHTGDVKLNMPLPPEKAHYVQSVVLSITDIGANLDVIDVVTALANAKPALQSLSLISVTPGNRGAKALAKALPQMTSLRELCLSVIDIRLVHMKTLAEVLPKMSHLQVLDLNDNNLGPDNAAALAPALQQMPQLRKLDLSDNEISDAGATALVPALLQMPQLQSLDLSGNIIGVAGATALAPALPQMPQLQSLDLSYNKISADGATALVPALRQMPQLLKLDLSRNNLIGVAGAAALHDALPASVNLTI